MKKENLSSLGKQAEKLLSAIMDDMEKDAKAAKKDKDHKARYTLTDHMKVLDRVGKFEAIRAKLDTPEGSFFTGGAKGDDDDESEGS